MNDYIDIDNAMRVSGLKERQLQTHAKYGNIKTIQVLRSRKNGTKNMYHIDDCRKLSWPGTRDIAHVARIKQATLSARVGKYKIPGAIRIGHVWRFPPRTAELVLRWIKRGFPEPFNGIVRR